MPLETETIKKILDINQSVDLSPSEMAKKLKVTFFPASGGVDINVLKFSEKLKRVLINLGVDVIKYSDAQERHSFLNIFKRFFLFFKLYRYVIKSSKNKDLIKFKKTYYKKFLKFVFAKKIKKKIAIFCLGEGIEYNLPMDFTTSFKDNPIITILKDDEIIGNKSTFREHMKRALGLFAWNMTNLVICVGLDDWILYSFNLSHPRFSLDINFEKNILNSLIPKIAAPVSPPTFSEFEILERSFDPKEFCYKNYIDDLVESSRIFHKTGLFPAGKKIDNLNFRNLFYRWIGAIHLDERNGMSYGFLARQLPVQGLNAILLSQIDDKNLFDGLIKNEYVNYAGDLYVKIRAKENEIVVRVPEVWVLTSRSGAKKTDLDPKKDIIKVGLKSGQMVMQLPDDKSLIKNYKPSFDTKVILAHAVSNAIFACILKYFEQDNYFSKTLCENGFAIAHWHGYINSKYIPSGYIVYGQDNPPVSCSSPQAAIYAFKGKENGIINNILANKIEYKGDIHIEPHHGVNVSSPTLKSLAEFLLSATDVSKLGNEYFNFY